MRIELASGTPAILATPPGPPRGGIVIAPDIFGLRPLYDDLCARIAHERHAVVCAAEPFPNRELGPEVEPRFAAVGNLRDHDLLGDLVLASQTTGFGGACSLIGFCMGGMYAFKAAGLGHFRRVIAFYGMIRVPEAWAGPGHGEPLDALNRIRASPTLAIIGEKDPYTPPADVVALEKTRARVVRYPEAEHGFVHDPNRPAHRPADAADAWSRCFAFVI